MRRPAATIFKPAGVSVLELEVVVMTLDEFEALRLSDLEGLYQEQAAAQMNVSRATFGRILHSAHRKVADAIVHGKAMRIEGGPVQLG
jgi:uncharacterized protein